MADDLKTKIVCFEKEPKLFIYLFMVCVIILPYDIF